MASPEPDERAETPTPKDGEPGYVENPPLPPSFQTTFGYYLMSRYERLKPVVHKDYDKLKGKR